MAKTASNEEFKAGILAHLEETKEHVSNINVQVAEGEEGGEEEQGTGKKSGGGNRTGGSTHGSGRKKAA